MAAPRDNPEAKALVTQATKAMNKMFSFGTSKYEEAAELFVRAGNLFKASKQLEEAANAYLQAADCFQRVKQPHEAATNYVSAANCLRKVDARRAAEQLRLAISLYTNTGAFSVAAKHLQDAGEMYETENDTANAIECLTTAAEYYESENATSRANTCLLKVAGLHATAEHYDQAIELYEKVARASLDNQLLKWSVREYLFKALICHMAKGDTVGARRALERYQEMDVTFASQRECKLCTQLIEACEAYDPDAFTTAVAEFDAVTPLEPFKTTLLLRVKNLIKTEAGSSLT